MQLNLGTISPEQNNRIRGIMYKLGIEMNQKITKLDLFFILLDEKEKELFGENKAENFYIEKEKDALPKLKTREEIEMKYIKMYENGYLGATPDELKKLIQSNTDRDMEKQRIEQEKLIEKNNKQE